MSENQKRMFNHVLWWLKETGHETTGKYHFVIDYSKHDGNGYTRFDRVFDTTDVNSNDPECVREVYVGVGSIGSDATRAKYPGLWTKIVSCVRV